MVILFIKIAIIREGIRLCICMRVCVFVCRMG